MRVWITFGLIAVGCSGKHAGTHGGTHAGKAPAMNHGDQGIMTQIPETIRAHDAADRLDKVMI